MKWSRDTGRPVRVLFLLFLCFAPGIVHAAGSGDPGQAGNDLGSAAVQRFGSPGTVNSEISVPMTSRDTPMRTLDGNKSFSAQLLCPSSRKFIEVSIQVGGSGDLSQIAVSQDLDMDGNTDFVFSVPFPVSGVCANGIISCQAGTWGNCSYYRWNADSSARVGLATAAISNLGGCYCVNASCGSNLVQGNLSTVLRDLGGGVSGAVQAVNRKYAVTDVKEEGSTITYYGQDAGQCSGSPGSYGSSSPEQYYSTGSDAGLANAKDAAQVSQAGDPASYYSLIANSQAAQESQGDYRQCSVIRNVTVTTVTGCSSPGDFLDPSLNGCTINDLSPYPRTIKTHDGGGGGSCYFSQPGSITSSGGSLYIGNYLCGDPHGGVVKNARIRFLCGGVQVIVYSREYETAAFSCASGDLAWIEGWYYTSNANHISCPAGYTDGLCNGLCCMKPADRTDVINDTVDNRCLAYETDPQCRLRDEQSDGVHTFNNYNPTTLSPLSSCRTFTGYLPHDVCRDWWRKDRTYICETPGRYDFTDTKRRVDAVYSSSSADSGSLVYTDLRKDADGSWKTESVTSPLGAVTQGSSSDSCDQACKTKKLKSDTQAGKTGNKAQYQKSAAAYDFFYRLCRNGVCPAGDGEEVVNACGCLNDFSEAASVLSVLNAAGKDLICTTGARY
ncbi:MAG TPA: hypothetical protein PK793_09445 [Syntrophales bacterium]|nr:hypothetical protein [Syntrophales bacterium]